MPCNILKKSPSSAGHSPPPKPQQGRSGGDPCPRVGHGSSHRGRSWPRELSHGALGLGCSGSSREQWEWEPERRILRTYPWILPRGPRADPPQPNPTDPGTAECLDNRWIYMFALSLKSGYSPCQIPKNAAFCQQALLLFYLDWTKSIRLSSRHWGPLWSYTGITPMLLRSESGSGWTETEIAAYHEKETKEFVMNCDVTGKIRFTRVDGLKIYFVLFLKTFTTQLNA